MTTRFLVATVTLALCLSRAAAGQSCTPKTELEKYLTRSKVAKQTTVLAFDHSGQDWHAFTWDGYSVTSLTENSPSTVSRSRPRRGSAWVPATALR